MPERSADTGFWDDPVVQELPQEGKLLFIYLWTNTHCNAAGLYVITLRTMHNHTGIPEDKIQEILESETFQKKVKWYPDENLIWVKNFIKRQTKSPTFLKAVAKSLTHINNGAVQELLNYNRERYGIDIGGNNTTPTDGKLASISRCYERDLKLPLTPTIGEKLKEMSDEYPDGWFEDAVKIACNQNHKSLSYIEGILKRWKVEGKDKKKEATGQIAPWE